MVASLPYFMLSLFAEYLFHGAGLREVEEGNKSQSTAFIAAQRVHTLRPAHITQILLLQNTGEG